MSFSLKDPNQPLLFSTPSKLLILNSEVISYCFSVSHVPESKLIIIFI